MANEVTICNLALTSLGADHISSLNDNNTTAELCKTYYDTVRDAVIESAFWTFATVEAVSETQERTPWGDKYKHVIPQDWLKVERVYRSISRSGNTVSDGWYRQGNYVYSYDPVVYLWGTQSITNTNKFPALFHLLLSARMAVELCIAITEDKTMLGHKWAEYGQKLADAKNSDAIQAANEQIQSNTLIDARSGGGRGIS